MPNKSDNEEKEVYFDMYCERCKYWEKDALMSPCRHCLDKPVSTTSHRPVDFVEAREM